jgi:hypothetical protein
MSQMTNQQIFIKAFEVAQLTVQDWEDAGMVVDPIEVDELTAIYEAKLRRGEAID